MTLLLWIVGVAVAALIILLFLVALATMTFLYAGMLKDIWTERRYRKLRGRRR